MRLEAICGSNETVNFASLFHSLEFIGESARLFNEFIRATDYLLTPFEDLISVHSLLPPAFTLTRVAPNPNWNEFSRVLDAPKRQDGLGRDFPAASISKGGR